jgi:hypothetical protein
VYENPAMTFLDADTAHGEDDAIWTFSDLTVMQSESYIVQEEIGQFESSVFSK